MSRKEEIVLLEQMIHDTQKAMMEERRDKLQLQAELNELEIELAGLIIPSSKIRSKH